jgi:LPS O-antigen subunit length determinant protein (WzzB/FepE family)
LERLSHRDVAQASLVMLERSRIASQISGLDAERPGLAQKLLLPQTQPTELVGEIVAPTRPAAPRKVLIGALAVVLGLISGVMLALVADFLARAHR